MLKLDNIVKVYETGGENVTALRGVSLSFRENEFVAILGHSGCGKTTLLNIVGGLDQYTSGDLIINGRSTKEFKDRDWDAYRNHSIGFVFQSYNLIPHQSVLANVELALTLSGVGKAERRRRATEALTKVGLADQLRKRPNQLSGGQMQRVAIARALVNDPDILMADEPTGALDSETSVQVMDLLAEIAKDKLVIMVTHNPELAEQYATRTIRLLDGQIVSDSSPYYGSWMEAPKEADKRQKKPSMSFFTAFSLSLNNLMTKKGRTLLTSFAGSIGIIGIALILALSTGINNYINQVQEETLSSYPITIQAETVDMSAMMLSFMGTRQDRVENEVREDDRVYSSTVMFDMIDAMMNAETSTNNLKAFKEYLDAGGGGIADLANIRYGYDLRFDIYTNDEDGNIVKSDVMTLIQSAMSTMYGGDYSSYFSSMGRIYSGMDVWEELMPGENGELIADSVKSQYDLVYGAWPENYDEVILFISGNNEVSDLMLYALGFITSDDMTKTLQTLQKGEAVNAETRSWGYAELCDTNFKLILPAEYFQHDSLTGGYVDMTTTEAGMDYLYNSSDVGIKLKVVGVARPGEGAGGNVQGAIGYTDALTVYAIEQTAKMEIVKAQMADETMDVFLNLPFRTEDDAEPTDREKAAAIREHFQGLSTQEKADAYLDVASQPSDEYVNDLVESQMEGMTRESIEDMIIQQYASQMGVDASTIMGYIQGMDDETLFAQIEQAIAATVREQYTQMVRLRMASMTAEQMAEAFDEAMAAAEVENMDEDAANPAATPMGARMSTANGITGPRVPTAKREPETAGKSAFRGAFLSTVVSPAPVPEEGDNASDPGDAGFPEGALPEGFDPGAMFPEGMFPEGMFPEGFDPGAMFPEGTLPEGFDPGAMFPEGTLPEGFDPGAMFPEGTLPEGFDPGAMFPEGTLPEGFDPGAMFPDGTLPEGFDPGAMFPEGTLPEGFDPGAMFPGGTLPEGVNPGDFSGMFPGGTLPEGMTPSDLESLLGAYQAGGGTLPEGMGAGGSAWAWGGGGQVGGLAAMPTVTAFETWQLIYLYDNYMPPTLSNATYEGNLDRMGYVDLASPDTISIYATTFRDKDAIADLIAEYNAGVAEADEIEYTDYVALLMSSITDIISGISYLLIAFVSISLVVSSIMIGIITYISVLERTKEIGILRAVGASKRDISRVFNAETFIVGLGAGLIGIGVTLLLTIPINIVLRHVTNIQDLKSVLPTEGAVILVVISALLTIIAGLIPAKVAANKDPVVALRTE